MSHSLHSKFITLVIGAATIIALIAAWFGYLAAYRQTEAAGRVAVEGLISAIDNTIATGVYASDAVLLEELSQGIVKHPQVIAVSILDAQGQVLESRRRGPAQPQDPQLERVLASPFDDSEKIGRLQVVLDGQVLLAQARQQALQLSIAMAALIAAVALVLNYVALRWLSRPMAAVAKQLAVMAPGTEQRLSLPANHADNEIGTVVSATNRLLDATFSALNNERKMLAEMSKMEARYRHIFDSTSAGIFVLDGQGALINANPAVARLLNADGTAPVLVRDADFVSLAFADPDRLRDMVLAARNSGEAMASDMEMICGDGQKRWVHCLISSRPGQDMAIGALVEGVIYDVTVRKQQEIVALHQAEHDPLTGLKNRAGLTAELQRLLTKERALTAMFIDLDGFKQVNDQLGHDAGDAVLVACAQRLQKLVRRDGDTVARLGGDEMLVLLDGLGADDTRAQSLATLALEAVRKPVDLGDGRQAHVGASIGLASVPRNGRDPDALLRAADAAMYEAKRLGKNQWVVATPDQDEASAPAA